ncbi:hypothetical protein SAMN05421595_2694 [Austwickia chelonae]|uniref:Uncharacterized protein n=1 Tax=Austwickia chelonae NBRC 105200 TaxID=1184607 RepID=K6W9A6_9MICO|nr:hypothetical protein [Austwickia chelonae]GAB78427.1 hypothetical protein AUCHE_09_00330 [Austwickia chelonae NBRC 105200]SEW39421.1 hypothetical protein SAMN05421595_2694 [Austwickia chelonae]
MSPRDDEPDRYAGETRAERRRRLQSEAAWSTPSWPPTPDLHPGPAPGEPGPYDPLPYGVHAYPDIEDAVIEEYVEDPMGPAYGAAPAAGSYRDPWESVDTFVEEPELPVASPAPYPEEALTRPEEVPEPSAPAGRHVAHRAYGGRPAALPPAAEAAVPVEKAGPSAATDPGPEPPAPVASEDVDRSATPVDDAGEEPGRAAREKAPSTQDSPGEGTPESRPSTDADGTAPIAGLAEAPDPASAAAALQMLAAKAAAERLSGPRAAITDGTAEPAGERSPVWSERARRASERMAADKLAATRMAAVRAAAAQRAAQAETLRQATPTSPSAPTADPAAATPDPVAERTDTGGDNPSPSAPDAPEQGGPAGTGSPDSPRPEAADSPDTPTAQKKWGRSKKTPKPPKPPKTPKPKKPKKITPTWAKIAFGGATVLVLAFGGTLAARNLGALSSLGGLSPTPSATSLPTTATDSPTTSPTATTNPTGGGSIPASMACDPGAWAGKLADEAAAKEFTASAVAEAYCLTAGTVRDIGFTSLAARRQAGQPYTATEFDAAAAYMSPDLRTQWQKDVAALVRSQDPAGEAGRRISALTRLAWDNQTLKFDPKAKDRATDFAVGRPVTWTAKGTDGVSRLGLGFETGIVTHMVDGSGRSQQQILKRTYRIALIKAQGPRPWLIDAYQVTEQTAALSTQTVTPTATRSGQTSRR